ncbi:MAG TPA: hypothetical protein VFO70_11930 [Chitinophagaceae bacterium]|nr:hypothetical protein [Chitinophagaceae bacterium]
MKKLLVFAILFASGCSCKQDDIPLNIPSCIRNEVNEIKDDPNRYFESVDEYFFQNKIVYAFHPDGGVIADGSIVIKNADCSIICYLGGLGGVQLCNGENFFQNASFRRNIWKE